MNKSTKAIFKDLLKGSKLNLKIFLNNYGYSNISREISRKIEQPYSIVLKRDKKVSKNRFGESVWYYDYSLKKADYNKVKKLLNGKD